MKRWLIVIALFFTVFTVVHFNVISPAFAEKALLLDTHATRPLDSASGIFQSLGLVTTSRSDVFADASKLAGMSGYRIVILYVDGYLKPDMPDWAKDIFVSFVENGGILIGTGVDELSFGYGQSAKPNWLAVFHLKAYSQTDLMTNTSGWNYRVTPGMDNHPIVNNVYGAYTGIILPGWPPDCDGATPDTSVGCYNVFDLKNWLGTADWLTKVSVYHKQSNDGAAIWWNGNGNRQYFTIAEWTSGVMVGAFQNMIYWVMGLSGYDLNVSSKLLNSSTSLDPLVGAPMPKIGLQPLPREQVINAQVTSPWSYPGITTERYVCLGWTGDGVVVPASGTANVASFTLMSNAWLEWIFTKEFLIAVTSGQQVGAPTTEFNIWQLANTVASVTTTNFVPSDDPELGWRLSGYNGSGSVVPDTISWGYNDDPTVNFFCDGTGTIDWLWTTQYRLQVLNPRRIGVPTPPSGQNFFDQNDNILGYVQETVYQSSNVRYYCSGFSGTGAVPNVGSTNSVTFRLYTPSIITWNWSNEYRLDVVNPSGLGSPVPNPGYYWHPQDAVVVCSITSPMVLEGNTYIAVGYSLNGVVNYFQNTTNPSVVVTMSGPNDLRWVVQPADVELEVNSAIGAPVPAQGQHSYIFNDEITLSVASPLPGDAGERFVCDGFSASGDNIPARWLGNTLPDGSSDFTYTFNIRSNPTIITWLWKTQYTLTIESTLPNVLAIPAIGSYWIDSATYIEASVNGFYPGWVSTGYTVTTGTLPQGNRSYVNFNITEATSIRWTFTGLTTAPLFPLFGNIQTLSPKDPNYGRFSTIAIDGSTGFSHIAYYRSYPDGGGSLMYVYFNGIDWITELVDGRGAEDSKSYATDPADAGQYASIALDSNGRPHIAYYDARDTSLRYSYRTIDGNWIIETVDDGGGSAQVGEFCSLALNKFNEPYIAYYNRTNGNLMLATVNETGWNLVSPQSLGNLGSSAKIVMDPITQRPRIAFRNNDNNNLMFAYFNGADWVVLDVDTAGNTGNTIGLVLDSKGMAHIAYQAFLGNTNKLMYAVQSGNNFFRYEVETGLGTGYFSTIDMLEGDFPIIAYNDQSKHSLRYTFYDGEKWNFYTVDATAVAVGWYVGIARLNSRIYLAYWCSEGLRYTVLDHKSITSNTSTGTGGTGSGGGGGCFIATAAFGCYNSTVVSQMTAARDANLTESSAGCALVNLYYAFSPTVAEKTTTVDRAILRKCIQTLTR